MNPCLNACQFFPPPTVAPAPPPSSVDLLRLGLAIANRSAIADIESECVATVGDDGLRWYDTRPMIDPREHSHELIDMATEVLAYADETGLIRRHAQHHYLVRIASAQA